MKTPMVDEAVKHALLQVEICKSRIEAFAYAINFSDRWNSSTKEEQNACSVLWAMLYKQMNRAWQDLFMWSAVTRNTKVLKQARREAFAHFLSARHNIMEMVGCGGSWESSLEEEFRSELKELEVQSDTH